MTGRNRARPSAFSSQVESGSREENAPIDKLERIPTPNRGPFLPNALQVGPSSKRGWRGRQGIAPVKFPRALACGVQKSGTARRGKNRRSRVASLKLRAGSAASLASLSDKATLALRTGVATRSRS
jgi:hypothetical protein